MSKAKKKKRDITNDKARAWLDANPWFGEDEVRTAVAMEVHESVVRSGISPQSDAYWDAITTGLKEYDVKPDLVNHPPHYKSGGVETIDFIEAKQLGFCLGNVVKYISRAGIKSHNPLEDLKKAQWYLNREVARLEKAQ